MCPFPTRSISPRLAGWIVFTMLAMIAVPAAITLHQVRAPAILTVPPDPTPHGYTWSLLLFIIPIAVIAGWFLPSEGLDIPQRAFWRTIRVLVPAGFALDFFFAHRFFSFPNPAATLRIGAWALHGPVPFEEYVFYCTGFITILLMYIWLDEFWLAAYIQRSRLSRRSPPDSTPAAISSFVRCARLRRSARHTRIPYRFGARRTCTLRKLLPRRPSFHQLARPQSDAVHHLAGEPLLGSDPGYPLWLVGLPTGANDGGLDTCLVGFTLRSGPGVDGSYVRNRHPFRSV
jgi:hypothetical protein